MADRSLQTHGRHLALAAVTALALPAFAITGAQPTAAFGSVDWGVQITPDWVLTAEHTVLNPGDLYTNQYGTRVVAARYDAPESWLDFPSNDLALLRLVPLATAAPYLPVYGVFIPDGPISPALPVTIVSTNNTPAGAPRAYGYTAINASEVMIDPDGDGPVGMVRANYLVAYDNQVYVQSGDSGGALFAGHVVDSSVLMGITSTLYTDENDAPIGSAFVQPAAYRSWIDSTMAADAADTQVVLWTSAVPEPAAWLLWGAGAAGLLLRTQRRNRA